MKAHRTLSAAARAVLAHLSARGTATSADLRALQRGLGDARSAAAQQALPYNLRAMGYIDQVPGRTPLQWILTAAGHAAVARAAQDIAPERRTPPSVQEPAPPAQRIEFAGRRIQMPAGPRWVFDLAVEQTHST